MLGEIISFGGNMALVNCVECNKEISDTVKNCPHCGMKLTAPGAKTGGDVFFILMFVAGVFVVFFILQALFSADDPDNTYSAIYDGQKNLESTLKDPDSVEYGDVWAARMKTASDPVGLLVACGYFNARNGFGGMTGNKRFMAGAAGPVITDELSTDIMDVAWKETCIDGREY